MRPRRTTLNVALSGLVALIALAGAAPAHAQGLGPSPPGVNASTEEADRGLFRRPRCGAFW